MVYVISPVVDFAMYKKCILENKYLTSPMVKKVLLDNTVHNENISILYNAFLDAVDAAGDAWFIFCHEDFEFLADPVAYLDKADKNAVFGTFGARIITTLNNDRYREYVGKIYDCDKNGENRRILGREFPDGLEVDTLDCQCLMVHSSLIRQYGLRFDPVLSFNLYVEDFCLNALQHGVPVKVADIQCCHYSQVFDINDRQSFPRDNTYFTEKYKSSPLRAGICYCVGEGSDSIANIPLHAVPAPKNSSDIYRKRVDPSNSNIPCVLAAGMMKKESAVWDIGCASGDNGVFFKEKLHARLWGVDYNRLSVERALETGVYEDVRVVDLENFQVSGFCAYYNFFDHIFLGDVLEHLKDPYSVLESFKLFLKPHGSIFVSVPNIAHAYVLGNLLKHSFQYEEWGILDSTHLRFFTKKSLAKGLAGVGLKIKNATATFLIPYEYNILRIPKILPQPVYDMFFNDKHFFAHQYVVELQCSGASKEQLTANNYTALDNSPENNSAGFAAKQEALAAFAKRLRPQPVDAAHNFGASQI